MSLEGGVVNPKQIGIIGDATIGAQHHPGGHLRFDHTPQRTAHVQQFTHRLQLQHRRRRPGRIQGGMRPKPVALRGFRQHLTAQRGADPTATRARMDHHFGHRILTVAGEAKVQVSREYTRSVDTQQVAGASTIELP